MTVAKYPKKILFLAVVGVLAIVFVLATLFTSFTETQTDLSSTIPLPLGGEDFMQAVESVVGSPRRLVDSDITVIDNGDVFLADLLGEIAAAERSVTITNYIFREGKMANSVFDALAARAREGIEVRVMLDGQGASEAPEERIDAVVQAGGKVERFRPLSVRSLTRYHKRTHARAIVVDGEVGYTGGLAFDDGWLGDGVGEKQWRDVMLKYGGELARATQDQFNGFWRQTNGEILSGPAFYPVAPEPAAVVVADSAAGSSSSFVPLFHTP